MDDRFRFRAWDRIHKKYWEDFQRGDLGQKIFTSSQFEFIIEQSTGLSDRKGNLIMEGDIIVFPHWEEPLPEVVRWGAGVDSVGWFAGMAERVKNTSYLGDAVTKRMLADCEIVGNIHENPELLTAIAKAENQKPAKEKKQEQPPEDPDWPAGTELC